MDNLHAGPPHILFGASASSVQRAGGPNFPKGGTVKPGGFSLFGDKFIIGRRQDRLFAFLTRMGFLRDALRPETKCARGCSSRCEPGVKSSVKKRAGPPRVVNQTPVPPSHICVILQPARSLGPIKWHKSTPLSSSRPGVGRRSVSVGRELLFFNEEQMTVNGDSLDSGLDLYCSRDAEKQMRRSQKTAPQMFFSTGHVTSGSGPGASYLAWFRCRAGELCPRGGPRLEA